MNPIAESVQTFEHVVLDNCQIKDLEFVKCIQDLEDAMKKEFSWLNRGKPNKLDELFDFFTP